MATGLQDMNLPISIVAREPEARAIDALYRAVNGLDTGDLELFTSTLNSDIVVYVDDQYFQGIQNVVSNFFLPIAGIPTTHLVTNPRAHSKERLWPKNPEVELSATVLAQQYPLAGKPKAPTHLLAGYLHKLRVTSAPIATIIRWKIKTVWAHNEGTKAEVEGTPEKAGWQDVDPVVLDRDAPPSYEDLK